MGLDGGKVGALLERARREVDEGLLPACQVALALDGELVVFEAFGEASTSSRFHVFSATKPVVASVIWLLIDEGKLALDDRIADLVPELTGAGMEQVTLEHVLLHTSGFPLAPMAADEGADAQRRRARFASWQTTSEPGTRFEYHATSAHWVLADIIERVEGADFRDVVRKRVLDEIGCGLAMGVPPGDDGDVLDVVPAGEPATPEELEAVLGVRTVDVGEVTETNLLRFNAPSWRASGSPGAGGVGTAADLALLHQAFLGAVPGPWALPALADGTSHVRNALPDPVRGVPVNRTTALIVAGDDGASALRGMGHTVSPRAFGHNGAGGQIAWADPATGLSFGYVTNGIDRHLLRQPRRGVSLSSRAAVCAS